MCAPVCEHVYICVGVNTGMHMLMCGTIEYASVCVCVCERAIAASGNEWTTAADEDSHSGRPL